jgi:hypothetical protein
MFAPTLVVICRQMPDSLPMTPTDEPIPAVSQRFRFQGLGATFSTSLKQLQIIQNQQNKAHPYS